MIGAQEFRHALKQQEQGTDRHRRSGRRERRHQRRIHGSFPRHPCLDGVFRRDPEEEQHRREIEEKVERAINQRLGPGRPVAEQEIGADMDPAHQRITGAQHEHRAGEHPACVVGPVGRRDKDLPRDDLVDHREDNRNKHQAGQLADPVVQNVDIADDQTHQGMHVLGRVADLAAATFGDQLVCNLELFDLWFLCHGMPLPRCRFCVVLK